MKSIDRKLHRLAKQIADYGPDKSLPTQADLANEALRVVLTATFPRPEDWGDQENAVFDRLLAGFERRYAKEIQDSAGNPFFTLQKMIQIMLGAEDVQLCLQDQLATQFREPKDGENRPELTGGKP